MNTTKISDWISDWWKSVFPDLSSVSDWSISHKDVKLAIMWLILQSSLRIRNY